MLFSILVIGFNCENVMFDKARPYFKKRIKFNGQWKKLHVSDNLGFKKRKTTYVLIHF